MKNNTIALFALAASCIFAVNNLPAAASSAKCDSGVRLRVSSYNIRYDSAKDGESGNSWDARKAAVADLIKQSQIDVGGTQEGDERQMADLKKLLPEYDYVAHPYGGKQGNIHTAAIVYRSDKYKVLDKGVFWFSETPNEKSIGWDATDTRICTWAKMKDNASGQEFYFFTAHFYWRYVTARQNSGPLMVRMVKEITKDSLPVICTGDFNSPDTTPQYKAITEYLKDAYHATATPPLGPKDTNMGAGNFRGEPRGRIDFVFINDRTKVLSYTVLTSTYDKGRHPSDHLPIVCDVLLKK
ncbi:endonuclease/exonuclease/phosphatase family protein [Ereboglobus sp. PH5-5]|uniref:endonuclease/exonuclease/phosphatase family protein n=1 Tax=Ereboglobus sp. PH5-5 TaxID=2940529 RepID=UPI00240530E9|nr:endonuclease/exonuclease/phosphatase family protein [Ereboglobus sp. PH5-5]